MGNRNDNLNNESPVIEYLTVDQVAERLQTTPNTIRRKISQGKIPVHPWMDHPRIPILALDNWELDCRETFIERKLMQRMDEKDKEIMRLKEIIKKITVLGMEAQLSDR